MFCNSINVNAGVCVCVCMCMCIGAAVMFGLSPRLVDSVCVAYAAEQSVCG